MPSLNVLCWNVLATPHTHYNSAFHGQPGAESLAARNNRYARNHALLLRVGADILCLQEADEAFVSLLQPTYTILQHKVNRNREGCALLVRGDGAAGAVTVTRATSVDLGGGKSAVFMHFAAAPGGVGVWLATAHLAGGQPALATRTAQLQAVQAAVAAASGAGGDAALILCGDLNDTSPEAMEAGVAKGARLSRAPGDVESASGLSADFSTAVRIDHVLQNAAAQGRVGGVQLPYAPGDPWRKGAELGSDHAPLIFEMVV